MTCGSTFRCLLLLLLSLLCPSFLPIPSGNPTDRAKRGVQVPSLSTCWYRGYCPTMACPGKRDHESACETLKWVVVVLSCSRGQSMPRSCFSLLVSLFFLTHNELFQFFFVLVIVLPATRDSFHPDPLGRSVPFHCNSEFLWRHASDFQYNSPKSTSRPFHQNFRVASVRPKLFHERSKAN